jgi:hypothetical protein
MSTPDPKPISPQKLEANRRNAQKSTGPTTEEGKRISSMNALRDGLLTREVVITLGDYKEEQIEFLELLDSLWEMLKPVGCAEELEVENIAKCYWHKPREARAVNAIIRRRTLGMRDRLERRRDEDFENRVHFLSSGALEQTARGLQYVIDTMERVKEKLEAGQNPEMDDLEWLRTQYPDDFEPDETQQRVQAPDGRTQIVVTPEYLRQVIDAINQHLPRLAPLRVQATQLEEMQLRAQIEAAALPIGKLTLISRYATSNDRELERGFKRLDMLQQLRRASGRRPWPS